MKVMFTFLFIALHVFCQAQDKKAQKIYLLLRIEDDYDKDNQRAYFKIIPDAWCDHATEIYELQQYNNRKGVGNTTATVYHNRVDSSRKFYNYFWSASEALNFMSANGWTFVSVLPGNTSDGGSLIQTIVSRQVFCFSKEYQPGSPD